MTDLDRFLAAFERQELSLDQLLLVVDRIVAAERGDGSRLLAAIRAQPWKSRLDDGVRLAVEHRVVAAEAAARARSGSVTASRKPNGERTEVVATETRLPRVGDVIKQRFELVEELGAGGMGKVFKALDRVRAEARDREPYVAIKILSEAFHQHAISAIALQREAKKTLRLSHPSVVHVYDFDRDGPLMFMTMEYLSGQSLDKMLREPGFTGASVEDVLTILRPLAAALTHAHQQGLVHSDFKPSNVFVTDDGRVKIIDFGIARAVHRAGGEPDHTVFDPSKLGALTPPYASIEQIDGCDPDPRDDIYALACVTYELLTGRHPFNRASSRRAMAERMEPARPPKLSRRQWEGLKRALAFQREKRTPSVEAFVASLEPGGSRRRWLIALAAAVILAAGAAGVWWSLQGGGGGSDKPIWPEPDPVGPEFQPPDPALPKATRENLWPILDPVACAVLTTDLDRDRVILSGHAGPPAGIGALASKLRDVSGIGRVVKAVAPLDAVHCGPIDLTKPHGVANRVGGIGLAILPAKAAFSGGDELQIKVGGARRDGYLYVDYYSADGTVLHMLPRPGSRSLRVRAQSAVAIGEGSGTGQWSISAPYGLDLVAALLTPEPLELPGGRRPEVEPTEDYLSALKQALDKATAGPGGEAVAASLVVITTQPPGSR